MIKRETEMRCDLETTHIVDFLLDRAWRAGISDEFSQEDLAALSRASDVLFRMRCMALVVESHDDETEQDVVKD